MKNINKIKKYLKKSSPFIMHTASDQKFPTHTHGLSRKGMPEIIIDPKAFGPKGNGICIKLTYRYLTNLKNRTKLQDIKAGKTIKISIQDLMPGCDETEECIHCLRKVSPDFEAIKLAYPKGIKPEMWFMQIYVEGDDFVLTDEYYKAGMPSMLDFYN